MLVLLVDADWDSRRAMEYDCAGDGEGTARGRRERRFRSFLRHERMSVAMALAEFLRGHRTARAREEVEDELYDVPWHQIPPPPGMRPVPLSEVAGPQRSDRRAALRRRRSSHGVADAARIRWRRGRGP